MLIKAFAIYHQALNMGIPEHLPFEEKKVLRVLNQILLLGSIIPISYIILFYFLQIKGLYFLEILISLTSIGGWLLKGWCKRNISKIILLFLIPGELSYFPLFVGNIGAEFFYLIFVVLGFYILDNRSSQLLLIIYLITLLIISKIFILNHQYPEKYKVLETLCYYPNMLITASLITLSTYIFKHDTIRFHDTIEEQSKNLATKIQELKKRETILTQLLKELNHRVKNNLQIVSSLFTMQVYNSKNKIIRNALNDARYRIDAIALLHNDLYKKQNPLKPKLKTYIQELAQYNIQMFGVEESIEIETYIDDLSLKIETTSHVGLIINELLIYSFKQTKSSGFFKYRVILKIIQDNKAIIIEVCDANGNKNFFRSFKDSFSCKLINVITEQYNGYMVFNKEDKSYLQVWFHSDTEIINN